MKSTLSKYFMWSLVWIHVCLQFSVAIAAAVFTDNSVDHEGASSGSSSASTVGNSLLHQHVKRFSGLYTGPYFDTSIATNITAQLGTHAFLPCKVKQLGNKSRAREYREEEAGWHSLGKRAGGTSGAALAKSVVHVSCMCLRSSFSSGKEQIIV
ncbi:Hypothetical predicted protein [Cloeon dipterum]|uniref:Uncharacterized protein n=1 Tax=Cloeon dipterum TaxID=197152 RepID=A0A8S1DBG1_9INSE|nr:Hypothetical predicted protein [Cloeon dipterum]